MPRMAEEEVKLLGARASFFAVRVHIALEAKDVKYEYVEEDLFNKSQLLLECNPVHKKIPVLIHNGKPIAESLIILEYIDEAWSDGVKLLPRDPYERAVTRFWAAFVDDKLALAIRALVYSEESEESASKREAIAKILVLEEALGSVSLGKPFFGGETIGLVDIALGTAALWIRAFETVTNVKLMDRHDTPLLCAWLERFNSVECVKKKMPDLHEIVAYGQTVIPSWKKMAQPNNQ